MNLGGTAEAINAPVLYYKDRSFLFTYRAGTKGLLIKYNLKGKSCYAKGNPLQNLS